VNEALPQGYGRVYLDAGYDDNKTIGVLFNKGYYPVVCVQTKTGYVVIGEEKQENYIGCRLINEDTDIEAEEKVFLAV
jgi:hypothetical protein